MRYGSDDPRFLRFIIAALVQKLYQTSSIHVSNVLSLTQRFAAYLLKSCPSTDRLDVSSRESCASLLGATSRHLNRVLRQLEARQIIRLQEKTIILLDRAALQACADVG